jgi:hypothetical protein
MPESVLGVWSLAERGGERLVRVAVEGVAIERTPHEGERNAAPRVAVLRELEIGGVQTIAGRERIGAGEPARAVGELRHDGDGDRHGQHHHGACGRLALPAPTQNEECQQRHDEEEIRG